MSFEQLRKHVNSIMYKNYDRRYDIRDMLDIVVDRLITDYMYDDYVVNWCGETIKTLIEEWINENSVYIF